MSWIEEKCIEKGLRMTEQRKVIAAVLSDADDHPDAEGVYMRASKVDAKISLATVYRTLRHLICMGRTKSFNHAALR